MIGWINIAAAVLTIGFGCIAWLNPRYAMLSLDLSTTGDSTLGLSEIRAASGALFVGLGLAALILSHPIAYAMVGFAYAGAAVGRLTSIALDGSGNATSWSFAAIEIVFAAWLIGANLFVAR